MKFYITLLLILLTFNGYCQQWEACGGNPSGSIVDLYVDTIDDVLYASNINNGSNVNLHGIGKWDGLKWSTLGQSYGGVRCITRYNSEIYYCGYFKFNPFGALQGNVARWDGSNWVNLGTGFDPSTQAVICMTVYNNELYVGGIFNQVGGNTVSNIARWNGTSWNSVGSGLDGRVDNLCVFNGELIANGAFTNSGSTPLTYIARWNGNTWQPIGTGLSQFTAALFADHDFLYFGDGNTVHKWDGVNITAYPPLAPITGNTYQICTTKAGDLFVSIPSSGSSNNVSKFTALGWVNTAQGFNDGIYDLAEYHGQLFASGQFYQVNSFPANGIAKFGCTLDINTTKTSCPLMCDGGAASIVNYGSAPFSYQWSNGNITDSTIANLCSGNYTITISDGMECIEKQEFSIVSKPNVALYLYGEDPSCSQSCDGVIYSYATGGTPPYAVNWSNNASGDSIYNLCSGSYYSYVTDSAGCKDTSIVTLVDPPAIDLVILKNDLSCDTCCDGKAVLYAEGGTPPYNLIWENNGNSIDSTNLLNHLCQGTYTACITDRNNCLKCDSITIAYPKINIVPQTTISVSPSPIGTSGFIQLADSLSLIDLKVEIYNSLGEILKRYETIQAHTIKITHSEFRNGIYFIKVTRLNQQIAYLKFVII